MTATEQWGRGRTVPKNEQVTATLWQAIEDRRDELLGIVAARVRRPSLLGQEAEVQAYVADHLRGSGMATEPWDLDESIKSQPNAGDSGVPFPGQPKVPAQRAAH